jgi:hypothetical protein
MTVVTRTEAGAGNDMSRWPTPTKYLSITAWVVATAGCLGPGGVLGNDPNDDQDPILVGTISVTTTTTGAQPDPDGYMAALDEARAQQIPTNGTVSWESIAVGTYGIRLDGVAGHCNVTTPNPLFVTLMADSSLQTQFAVDCP